MSSTRESELTLINYIIRCPAIYKENEENLKAFPFEYPYSRDIYKIVVTPIKKHGTSPTLVEAKRLADKVSDQRSHTSIQRSKLQDDLEYTYMTASSAASGDVFTNYVFAQGARELANKILVSSPDDFKKHYFDLKEKLDCLSTLGKKEEESLGVSLMYGDDINSCIGLMQRANTADCIATGFPGWDNMLQGGFRPGEVAMIMASTGMGKAQPLYSKILTPTGFVEMRDAYVGMEICNSYGGVSKVVGVFPQGTKDVYELSVYSEVTGTLMARSCDDHLWNVKLLGSGDGYSTIPLRDFKESSACVLVPVYHPEHEDDDYVGIEDSLLGEVYWVDKSECQCISTDAKDGCYITDDFIVTHNTAVALNIAFNNAVDFGKRVVYITMDNQIEEVAQRFFCRWLDKTIDSTTDYEDTFKLLTSKVEPGKEHNFILQTWLPQKHSPGDVVKYINRLQEKLKIYDLDHGVPVDQCGHIDLIIIDYLEKMIPDQRQELYRQALFHIADGCVIVAKTFGCPVILASQSNKESMKSETAQVWQAGESYAKLHPCAHVCIMSMTDEERLSTPARFRIINGKNRRPETNYCVPMIFDKYTQCIKEDPDRPIIALNSTLKTDAGASSQGQDWAEKQANNAAEVAHMWKRPVKDASTADQVGTVSHTMPYDPVTGVILEGSVR